MKITDDFYDKNRDEYVSNVVMRFIDSSFVEEVVGNYNINNSTDFTWVDFFEDHCNFFRVYQGIWMPLKKNPITGKMEEDKELYPFDRCFKTVVDLVKKRDHASIIRLCKSFCPYERAHGALSFYLLELEGSSLSGSEKELLSRVVNSSEMIKYGGCTYDYYIIRDVLTAEFVANVYADLKRNKLL